MLPIYMFSVLTSEQKPLLVHIKGASGGYVSDDDLGLSSKMRLQH